MVRANYFILVLSVLAGCGGKSTESDADVDERAMASGASAPSEDGTGPQDEGETGSGGYTSGDRSEPSEQCAGGCPERSSCIDGKCRCEAGLTRCGDYCSALNTIWECGSCGHSCFTDSACIQGECVFTCANPNDPVCPDFRDDMSPPP